jgi:hypothetical protein
MSNTNLTVFWFFQDEQRRIVAAENPDQAAAFFKVPVEEFKQRGGLTSDIYERCAALNSLWKVLAPVPDAPHTWQVLYDVLAILQSFAAAVAEPQQPPRPQPPKPPLTKCSL